MASTIISRGSEPPGMPATPMAVTTDMRTTSSCWGRARCTPKTWARKRTVAPSKRAVPFMFMVAPRGRTKPAIWGEMPRSRSAVSMVVGRVALLELVEKAVTITTRMRRKNSRGARRARSLRTRPYPRVWKTAMDPRTVITYPIRFRSRP